MIMIKSIENAAKTIATTLNDTSFYNILRSWYYTVSNEPAFNHGKTFNTFKYFTFYASANEKRYAIVLIDNKGSLNFIFESKQPQKVANWVVKNKDMLIAMINSN